LQRLLGDEGALKRMRPLDAAEAFDRGDVLVRDRPQRRIAGSHRVIVDQDIAGTAFARAAAEMRTRQTEMTAQNREQRRIGIGVDLGLDAVEAETNVGH